jgi:hypothetical protein
MQEQLELPETGVEDRSTETDNGAEPAFAPVDPVLSVNKHGQPVILGGFSSDSMTGVSVEPSAEDRLIGDEAIAEAVQRELKLDSATTSFVLHVYVRRGVVHLRGQVADLDDIDNAESVAARIPGVREVMEELELALALA